MTDDAAELVAHRWHETAPDAVLLDGFHALKHALRFDADLRLALTDDKAAVLSLAADVAPDVVRPLRALAVEVPTSLLRGLVPRVHPTRVVALAGRPSATALRTTLTALPRSAPLVVLEAPRNLGNVGAVIRLAAGLGATGVVTVGDLDPWHPNAVRASAGLHFATAVERLDRHELPPGPLYVLDPAGEDLRSVPVPDDALLAFGSERHGISPALRDQATKLVAIPMRPRISSFNLATTVAMALYHWLPSPHPAPALSAATEAAHRPAG